MAHLGNTVVNGALRVLGGEYVDTINGVTVGNSPKFTDTTYGANNGVGLSGTTFYNSGVRAVATGGSNGTINVNTNGGTADVAVKGLGAMAYKASVSKSDVGLGNVANYDQSKAIKSITRSGTTFTATALDGTTSSFTQQDNNTTYSNATTAAAGLMSKDDKVKLNGIATGATANTGTVTSVGLTAGDGISVSGGPVTTSGSITVTNKGVRSIATGGSNGTINVNTNGSTANVAVKGLGSAAYTNSTAYAASGHNHDGTYLKLSGGTMTGDLTLGSILKDSRFASSNQQVLNVGGGDNTNLPLYVGNPTNCADIHFETKNGTKNLSSLVTAGSQPYLGGVHFAANANGPFIYSENGNINFRCGTDGNYDQYANVKDLKFIQDTFLTQIMDSNSRVKQYGGDLNNISVTSFYNFDIGDVANYPAGLTGQAYVITLIHSNGSNYATQIFLTMNGYTNTKMYIRNKNNGTWNNQCSVMTGSVSGTTLNITL